ncbi:MAG: EF2563 family selenium-dependent molybdenum hydroxylase system protein [Anaerolineales bacterium]|nr:EF2563 family selenium-dependent molybdenum hydroxylase system protein [Anaerolineales bacterium]
MYFEDTLVLVRGGGDLGTGVAHRLHRAGFTVMVTELPQPLCVRRAVAFAEAVYAGSVTVEGVVARYADDPMIGMAYTALNEIPVVVDAQDDVVARMKPPIVVDARLAKTNLGTRLHDAKLVIGLGPGFSAGKDCHAVVETNRGQDLGRVYWEGGAEADTGQPEPVRGFAGQRVLRSPADGVFIGRGQIGDLVQAGDVVAEVDGKAVVAALGGVVRGLLHDGVLVTTGLKIGDLDPRGVREYCFIISDKARAIGGGVLEAMLSGIERWYVDSRDRDQP